MLDHVVANAKRPSARVGQGSSLLAVAGEARVHPSTVSRILRDDPAVRVRPATRQRVIAAAAALGYVPNANARGLALRRTTTLGLIIPSTANIVYEQIIKGAESAARAAGYVLVLAESADVGQVDSAHRELILGGRVDGLLIASGTLRESLPRAVLNGVNNTIILNRRIRGSVPSIIEDDERGMARGVEHLVALGHTRIACLAGPEEVDTATRRLSGFKEALRAAGLPVSRGYIQRASFDEAGGYEAMLRLLQLERRPTAVAASSIVAAIGALAACHATGVSVPGELSMIAFHDATIAQYLTPSLSTIWMPLFELGEMATRQLLEVIDGRDIPSVQRLQDPEPRVIPRASTAPPPAD
ncbi:MAG: transcriptional regulator [Acidimicrobiaceae bacterium]|nr:transcriptional regulator [Acidimicrobiaceae bacterium]